MNIEEVREFALSLKNATEGFPFGEEFLVFKVEGKMFLLLPLEVEEPFISVKCHPDFTDELRDRYSAVEPAWHFNKKYWNMIYLERDMPEQEICRWIRHSYQEVLAKLPKKTRELYATE